jgi:hypothetical protein
MLLPLLIGAFWMLINLLALSLCIAARDGDRQQNRPTSPAVRSHRPEAPAGPKRRP